MEIILYIIFGGITTGIDWILYYLLRIINCNYILANIISWIFAVLFAFITNKYFVFKKKDNINFLKEFISFFSGRVITGIIQLLGIFMLVSILNINEYLSKAIISIIVLVLNFIISKLFIFKQHKLNFINFKNKSFQFKLASFLIPFGMMLLLFILKKIFPFGDDFFVKSDGYHQYIPFLKEFAIKIQSGENLFYTFNLNLGSNFLALYAYYLASPLNWLLLIVPIKYITEFAGYMMLLKVGLSGLTFYYLLEKHNNYEKQNTNFGSISFSTCYAFSGYFAAYNWNIMWIDCLILFPLIILGIEKIIQNKKYKLYIISLSFCILSNYYISIMICLFCVIYYIFYSIENNVLFIKYKLKDWISSILKFIGASLLSGCIFAMVLIPEIFALSTTASEKINFPKELKEYFSILDLIPRQLINVQLEMSNTNLPNIYMGVIVFLLIPIYYLCKNISIKQKICKSALLLFLGFSFSLNILDFVWHGLHYPNSLPARQSFIYILILLLMCNDAFYKGIKTIQIKQLFKIYGGITFIFLCIQKFCKSNSEVNYFGIEQILLSFFFISIYVFLFVFIKKYKHYITYLLSILTVLICTELCINFMTTSLSVVSRSDYTKYDNVYEKLLEKINFENNFVRIEKRNYRTKNDGAWYQYPSISTFSSMSNKLPSDLYKQLGLESSWNAANFQGSTAFTSALLGVKYELSDSFNNINKTSTLIKKEADEKVNGYLYENKYVFPLGFSIPNKIKNVNLGEFNPANNQNYLSNLWVGKNILLDETDNFIQNQGKTSKSSDYYAYISNVDIKNISGITGEKNVSFENVDRGYLLYLGNLNENTQIILQDNDTNSFVDFKLYCLDESVLNEITELIKEESFKITKFKENNIKGTITIHNNKNLLFTIPYDKGWKVYIDGKEVETITGLHNTFLTVPISSGHHEIELKYIPHGWYLGLLISGVTFLILIILYSFNMKNKSKKDGYL